MSKLHRLFQQWESEQAERLSAEVKPMDKTPEQMLVELLHQLLSTEHMEREVVIVNAINRDIHRCISHVPGLLEWWNSIRGQEETQQRILRQSALDKLTRDEAHALGLGCDWDARQSFKEAMVS